MYITAAADPDPWETSAKSSLVLKPPARLLTCLIHGEGAETSKTGNRCSDDCLIFASGSYDMLSSAAKQRAGEIVTRHTENEPLPRKRSNGFTGIQTPMVITAPSFPQVSRLLPVSLSQPVLATAWAPRSHRPSSPTPSERSSSSR